MDSSKVRERERFLSALGGPVCLGISKGVMALLNLNRRKRHLVVETPFVVRGRPIIAHVEAFGLRLREKGRRFFFEISWAQIFHRAAEMAPERDREQRRKRRPERP
jgi:hypothetical protein